MRKLSCLLVAFLLHFTHTASLQPNACNVSTLPEMIRHVAITDAEDGVKLDCEDGYEPSLIEVRAVCRGDQWEFPVNFHCRKPGFCKLFVKSGPSIKVLPLNGYKLTGDIVEDGDRIIVNCKSDPGPKTFSCRSGEWYPREENPCKIIQCPPPPDLENGRFIRVAGEVAEPICDGDALRSGSELLYCRNGTWVVKRDQVWPSCAPQVTKTVNQSLQRYHWVALGAGVFVLIGGVILVLLCYLRKESPKRNRLMHTNSHVDELLHLRRTKPIVIPDPVSHTQVHYTHDRKPIPVTSL